MTSPPYAEYFDCYKFTIIITYFLFLGLLKEQFACLLIGTYRLLPRVSFNIESPILGYRVDYC